MIKGHIIRLYPTNKQIKLLEHHFGCTRWLYNEMIVINQKRYKRTGKTMSGYDMQNMVPKLKKQHPWLKNVGSACLQITCHNLADAYNRFFKHIGNYPKFKNKDGKQSFSAINDCYVNGNKLKLPKFELMRFRGGELPNGKPKRFTVKKEAGKYYASILFDDEKDTPKQKIPKTITGLDVGLTDAVVTSYGKKFTAPKILRSMSLELRKKQKALARGKKGSNRRSAAKHAVAILHQKIKNKRKDFNHKLSNSLVSDSKNHAFGIEDLNIKGMMQNRKLSKAIGDVSWYQLKTFLQYKAAAVGKPVIEVGRFYPSSKACSACGVVKESLPLSIREWTCGDCGAEHLRDVNAAINIAQEAARNSVFERRGRVIPVAVRVSANEARSFV